MASAAIPLRRPQRVAIQMPAMNPIPTKMPKVWSENPPIWNRIGFTVQREAANRNAVREVGSFTSNIPSDQAGAEYVFPQAWKRPNSA